MKNKIILITSIVFASIVVLVTIFGLVDYNRALNGKKPIFIYRTVNVSNFDINKEGTEYYGVGYKISICNNENKNYTFQVGYKKKENCYTNLSCSETYGAKNEKHSYDFSFFDGKLYHISATFLVPIEHIENEETFAKDFLEYHDVVGVDAAVKKINETTYEIVKTCNLFKMSSIDIEKACTIDYFDSSEIIELTRTKIDDNYYKDACK